MPTVDFDSDGTPEIAVIGSMYFGDQAQSIVQIYGHSGAGGWTLKQSIIPPSERILGGFGAGAGWVDYRGPHLLFAQSGEFSIYSGWPLKLDRQFNIDPFQFADAVVADTDGDGEFELIETAPGWNSGRAIQAYSLVNGERLWSYTNPDVRSSTALIAQLDDDPALEVATGIFDGVVVDGATHQVETEAEHGFGTPLVAGQFGNSEARFVGFSEGHLLQAFHSPPWIPAWTFAITGAATEAIAADTNHDGIDELIYYSGTGAGGINVFDMTTRSIRHHFGNKPMTSKLAAGDFDNDGRVEIAIANSQGAPRLSQYVFEVIDAETGTRKFGAQFRVPGPYVASNFMPDLEGNEIVVGSSEPTDAAGALSRINLDTGVVAWGTPVARPPFDTFVARSIISARISGYEFPVVFASGKSRQRGSGLLMALDSRDGNILWSLSSDNNSALSLGVDFRAITIVDSDQDGQKDSILVCTDEPRLREFRLADRVQTWASNQLESFSVCQNVFETTSGKSRLFVAASTRSIRAFDADTHQPQWTIPYDDALFLATYIGNGSTGAEIAVVPEIQRNAIDFFDVVTHNWLRRIELPSADAINTIAQPSELSLHELIVAAGNRIFVVDGFTGEIRASSDVVGVGAAPFNQLALRRTSNDSYLLGFGSAVALLAYRLTLLPDSIFSSDFEKFSR